MIPYLGDFQEDATVYIPFNTFDSNDPSASVTITNLAAGDVHVHKDGSTTQATTNGATVSIDFDTITGNHLITIDTSADAYYATGSDYLVRIEGTTVDGATINAWVGQFSIQNRYSAGALRPTTAGRTLDVTATGAAGIDWGNVENASTSVDLSATSINLCDTVTTNTDMRGTDNAFLAASAPTNFGDLAITATTGLVSVGTNNDKSGYSISGTLTTLDALDTQQDAQHSTTQGLITTVDTVVDAILVDTGTTIPGQLDSMSGATFDTATDSLEAIRNRGDAAWTTGAGGTPPQLLQNTTIATLASQTSFTLTAGSADDDAYNGAVVVVTDSATSTQKCVGSVSDYVGSTKTVTLSADPGVFTMAAGDTIDIIANASTAPSAAAVRAEIDANSTQLAAIVEDTGTTIPAQISALNNLSAAQVNAEVDNALADYDAPTKAELDAGLAALNDPTAAAIADAVLDESLAGHVTAGTLGKAIADIEADATLILEDTGTTLPASIAALNDLDAAAVRAAIGMAAANLDTQLSSLSTQASVDVIDGIVDAILVDTDTTIPALIAALNDLAASDILTTQLTESYAADGAAPTLSQAIFLIQQFLFERSVTGTTTTIKKLDGATTAATLTLDDGTSPTSITRAS